MSETFPKWRPARVRFNVEVRHALIDYGNSTRGCQVIPAGTEMDVCFEHYDTGNFRNNGRIIHIEMHDVVMLKEGEEFEILELKEPQEKHPYEVLRDFYRNAEKLVENIGNVNRTETC